MGVLYRIRYDWSIPFSVQDQKSLLQSLHAHPAGRQERRGMEMKEVEAASGSAGVHARLRVDAQGCFVAEVGTSDSAKALADLVAAGGSVVIGAGQPRVVIPLEALVAASAKMAAMTDCADPFWDAWRATSRVQEIVEAVCQYAGIEIETPASPYSDEDWIRSVTSVAKSPKLDPYEAEAIFRQSGL
jgi:hypothetical protein